MQIDPWQRWLLMAIALTGLGLALAGCGAPEEPLTVVHGTVHYKGVPLSCGTIVFTPDSSHGGSGASARAEIKPDGTYILKTGEEVGTAPGWHHITVVAVQQTGPPLPGQKFAMPRSLVPIKYRDAELSGLRFQVKPGEDNTIDVNLD